MNTATASIIVAGLALAGVVFSTIQNRRGADKSSTIVERAQVFDELKAVKTELTTLLRRLKAATEYIEDCLADYRRRGIDPPPVRERAPLPWEE